MEAAEDVQGKTAADGDDPKPTTLVPIRAEHVTKIAAEMLMDFS